MPESRYSLGISGKNGLIDKSPGNISVVLDAAVAEEWPPAAHILAVLQVDIYHQALFFLIAGTVVELALRTGYETAAPELDALGLTARIRLETYAVYGDDRQSVGYGMAPHHGSPRLALALLLFLGIIGSVADGGRIDEYFGSLQRHQTGCFGIPLVPANQHAELAYRGLDRVETEVARSEIELLVVGRIVGDVHLAVFSGYASILLHHYRRIVVEPRSAALEEGGDDDDAEILGKLAVEIGRRARNRLCQVEEVNILYLTEIEGVMKLLKHDELCAAMGEVDDAFCQALLVVGDICRIMKL